MVGNEPNDPHQDDLSPGAYAAFFHRFATAARAADPTVRMASAGIANADCEWAAAFRDSYREQYGEYPAVDAWNIHNYILEPDRDQLDLAEFQRRIVAFRTWMDEIGEGDKPLFLSEFGALFGLSEGHLGRSAEDGADCSLSRGCRCLSPPPTTSNTLPGSPPVPTGSSTAISTTHPVL